MSKLIKIIFRCCYDECKEDAPNQINLSASKLPKGTDVGKEKLVYCRKGHPNIIKLPASWDFHPLVLGDEGQNSNDTIVIEGKKP